MLVSSCIPVPLFSIFYSAHGFLSFTIPFLFSFPATEPKQTSAVVGSHTTRFSCFYGFASPREFVIFSLRSALRICDRNTGSFQWLGVTSLTPTILRWTHSLHRTFWFKYVFFIQLCIVEPYDVSWLQSFFFRFWLILFSLLFCFFLYTILHDFLCDFFFCFFV